jgi:hypothetical protein
MQGINVANVSIVGDVDINYRYIQAKNKLSGYTVHFPKSSTVNVIIANLLHKIGVKSVLYEDSPFDVYGLNVDIDIVLNSNANDWVNWDNIAGGITINTWNYRRSRFDDDYDFAPFIEGSERYEESEEHTIAVRAVCDMLCIVTGVVYN